MAELAGNLAVIKLSGTATNIVGEDTTGTGNTVYQITDADKQVLSYSATIRVHKFDSNDTAEAETTTTTIKMETHGLSVNDLIINVTRNNAKRLVLTVPDPNTITVTEVTDQVAGDTIGKYPTEDSADYTLNRLSGSVTYESAVERTIKISGQYLPMAIVAYAHEYRYGRGCDLHLVPKFGDTHKKRKAGLKFAYGTLSQWDVTDSSFRDALGIPVVLEFLSQTGGTPERVWALFQEESLRGPVNGIQDAVVPFISTDNILNLI